LQNHSYVVTVLSGKLTSLKDRHRCHTQRCAITAMIVDETRWSLMFMGEGEEDPTDAGMHPVVSARIRPTQILGNAQGPQHCVQGVSTLSLDLTCHLSCQICYPRINEDTGAALKRLGIA
jgi:hypothetical protein